MKAVYLAVVMGMKKVVEKAKMMADHWAHLMVG